MKKIKELLELFFAMLKIGLFTFGGGYAMIHILDCEFVERNRWLESEEFMDLVTIAESTPGPIAINCSTYIGYKKMGFIGALFATVGMCIPSFVIIYLISLFFNRFLEVEWVASAFRGIQACVVFLILSASISCDLSGSSGISAVPISSFGTFIAPGICPSAYSSGLLTSRII